MLHWWDILIRLGIAVVAGLVVGLERERHHRPAGMKTHIMACMGAAIVSMIQLHMVRDTLALMTAWPEAPPVWVLRRGWGITGLWELDWR